jgi:putative intracellular protease/amidase
MVSFVDDRRLHGLVAAFYEAGKITAIVCHATCVLLKAQLSDGTLLAKGRTWTGFSSLEERYADEYVGQRLQPFRIEDEARKIEGTNFVVGPAFRAFAIRDGRLVTGQQQYSGAEAARLVIEALGR